MPAARQLVRPMRRVNERQVSPEVVQHTGDNALLAKAVSFRRNTYRKVPVIALATLVAAVKPALQLMAGAIQSGDNDSFTKALQCFCIIPQFALTRDSEKILPAGQFRKKLLSFLEGNWTQPRQPEAESKSEGKDESGLTEQQRKGLKRARRLAQEGFLGKASDTLQTAASPLRGSLPPTAEVIAQLQAMHPPEGQPVPDIPHGTITGLPITHATMRRAGKKIANGAAPDIFGWTGELIWSIMQDDQCFELFSKIVGHIRDGQARGEARDWLLSSWLIALDKGNDKVRPIAGTSILFKLAASYLMEENRAEAQALFGDRYPTWSLHTRRCPLSAARLTQLMLEADPKHIVLKTDFRNAFNNIPRHLVLQQLFQHPTLSKFFHMIHWTYSAPSFQFLRGSNGVAAVVKSCQGVRQGCVFGSLGFAIATLGMFTALRKEHPNILVVAILDDLCLSGEVPAVISAFDQLHQLAEGHNIPIQNEKCELLPPVKKNDSLAQLAQDRRLKIAKDSLPLLGTVVGRDSAAKRQWVRRSLESWQTPLQLLQHLPSQLALLVARTIGTSKANHIARALPPSVTLGPSNSMIGQCNAASNNA